MDEAFGESEAELFERADKELERCRRQPGESIAHFLAEMRRLRAQYYRIDPDSRISDKAWGQKLLQKASLSRRERLDCYYAAGASYDSLEIEKALRVRCGRTHEDEKKVSHPRERASESYRSPGTSNYNKKKVFVRRRVNHTHLEQGADENEDFDEMEPIEEEALDETMEPEDSMEEAISSAEEVDEEELKEVFAAGWKAKQKTAEVRKNRGWRKPEGRGNKPGGECHGRPETGYYLLELWQGGPLEGRPWVSERSVGTGPPSSEEIWRGEWSSSQWSQWGAFHLYGGRSQ